MRHYDELKSLESITGDDGKVIVSAQQRRQQTMEHLIHSTANNDATFELPHPTDVGWGFYGLTPVKPR